MHARVNLAVLKTTRLDSGALGPLAMVLHQFGATGPHRVGIHRNGKSIAERGFTVVADGPMQLDIDLSATGPVPSGVHCDCTETPNIGEVSPNGYVLFHASTGDGYSATVVDTDQSVIFDSTKLSKGDLFAGSLLEPGVYDLKNALGYGVSEISVTLTESDAKLLRGLEAKQVTCSGSTIEPATFNLVSSQGLVVQITDGDVRLVLTRSDKSVAVRPDRPVQRWSKIGTNPTRAKSAARG